MTNIKAPFLYKVRCNDCNSFIYKESLIPDFTCNINPEHTINTDYVGLLEDSGEQNTCKKDYKKHRKELIDLVISTGGNLPIETLSYAAAHFCLPKEMRDQFLTQEEQIELGKLFHSRATESRSLRWKNAQAELYNYVSLADAFEIGKEIEMPILRYLNYGIEGTTEGDCEGLFDYIGSISGTSYESTGFINKNIQLTVSGVTLQEISTIILNILRGI